MANVTWLYKAKGYCVSAGQMLVHGSDNNPCSFNVAALMDEMTITCTLRHYLEGSRHAHTSLHTITELWQAIRDDNIKTPFSDEVRGWFETEAATVNRYYNLIRTNRKYIISYEEAKKVHKMAFDIVTEAETRDSIA